MDRTSFPQTNTKGDFTMKYGKKKNKKKGSAMGCAKRGGGAALKKK